MIVEAGHSVGERQDDPIREDSLDDILQVLYSQLLNDSGRISASKGGFSEQTGLLIELTNPRARLSRSEGRGKLFSALGELMWYLTGTNQTSFITYYMPGYPINPGEEERIESAYGPKIYGSGEYAQIERVVSLLKAKPTSRKAVVQLFGAHDLSAVAEAVAKSQAVPEAPCTCSVQFLVRQGRLNVIVNMRSNDAYMGLPHDVFSFTMIQEIVARRLGVEVGTYKHFVGSMHLYERDREHAAAYIDEGWHRPQPMPEMPIGDPTESIVRLLRAEQALRVGPPGNVDEAGLEDYWRDIVRLLRAYSAAKQLSKEDSISAIQGLKREMSSRVFDAYLSDKETSIAQAGS
jgi:thymidylate synthase